MADWGYMIRKSQVNINHDAEISNSIGRSKKQGVNFDVSVVMNVMMVALALIPGGPQWRADEELKPDFAKTSWMNAQIGKIQTRKVHFQWSSCQGECRKDAVVGWIK